MPTSLAGSHKHTNTNSDWVFNLRTAHGTLLDDSDDDSDQDNIDSATVISATTVSEDAQLLKDFDLSSRQEAVDYKPNPWNIAKINAASRAKQAVSPKAKPLPKVVDAPRKVPKGRIVDSFKKQAARPQPANSANALKPGVPILASVPSTTRISAVPLLPLSSKLTCNVSSGQSAYRQLVSPSGLFRAIKTTQASSNQEKLPAQVLNAVPSPRPSSESSVVAAHTSRPTGSIHLSFSSPVQTSHLPHVSHTISYSSPSRPTFENALFLPTRPSPRGAVTDGDLYAQSGPPLSDNYEDAESFSRRAERMDFPQHEFENTAYSSSPTQYPVEEDDLVSPSHQNHLRSPFLSTYDIQQTENDIYNLGKSESVLPIVSAGSTMPRWLAAALPPLPVIIPVSESRDSAYYQSDTDQFAEPLLPPRFSSPPPPLRLSSSKITKRRRKARSPSHSPSHSCSFSPAPSPIRSRPLTVSHKPLPPRRLSPSPRQSKPDAYAFSTSSDPDAEWSTLPSKSRKKALPKTTGIKKSGRFRLPINITGKGLTAGAGGDGKKRVVKYMPPPMRQVTNVKLEDVTSMAGVEESHVIHGLGRTARDHEIEDGENLEMNSDLANQRSSPLSQPHYPSSPFSSSPLPTRFSPTLVPHESSSPSSVHVPVQIDAIMTKYPTTRALMSKRRRASAQIWGLLDLDSCAASSVYRDADRSDTDAAKNVLEDHPVELPIITWLGKA